MCGEATGKPEKESTNGSVLEWKSHTSPVPCKSQWPTANKARTRALVKYSRPSLSVCFLHLAATNQQRLLSLKLNWLGCCRNNGDCGTPTIYEVSVLFVALWVLGSTDGKRKNKFNVLLSSHPRRDVFAAN